MKAGIQSLIRDLEKMPSSSDMAPPLMDECNDTRVVCGEVYQGNLADLPWHDFAWSLEGNCSKRLQDSLSVILFENGHHLSIKEQIHLMYPGLTIFISPQKSSNLKNILLHQVKTAYVFIGHNLAKMPLKQGDLERTVRLLSGNPRTLGAVSGATKNATGHWKTHCWQAEISAHNLVLSRGYHKSHCDCLICTMLWDDFGPFTARTKEMQVILDATMGTLNQVFVDFFLSLGLKSKTIYSCPDVMFTTVGNADLQLMDKSFWLKMAFKWTFQGISVDVGPSRVHQFTCHELDLACQPEEQTKDSLVPWCCIFAANHIVKTLNLISQETGLHYELDSGSLLGAVKLNNFIPWDVDGDLYISSESMHLFHANGLGRFILANEGISIFGWNEDNYWDKGAGHYQLSYKGLEFELMGKRGNLTLRPDEPPTLVQFGNSWARSHHHPGRYLRGRYGSNYLKHAQSWRFMSSMNSAFDSYQGGNGWQNCKNQASHACLSRYPTDGNFIWLPHRYP